MASSTTPSCVICTDKITSVDISFPPPCPRKCDANVCLPCLIHLSSSSPMCPKCGSILYSNDLQDTILLRRYQLVTINEKLPDSELGAKELRERMAFAKGSELERKAKKLVGKCSGETPSSSEEGTTSTTALFQEDNNTGSKVESTNDKKKTTEFPVDETLFEGRLDYSTMSHEEKCYVSSLLTSGEADQLAQAAQILMGISDMYASDAAGASPPPTSVRSAIPLATPSSEREAMVIRALSLANDNNNNNNDNNDSDPTFKSHRKAQQKKLEKLKELHPLPTRMPKCISLSILEFGDPYKKTLSSGTLLKFEDEKWDGSVSDAFSWVHSNRIEKGGGGGMWEKRKKKRVLVSKVKSKVAARSNVAKGDIVTHVNGEVFEGTADDLKALISQIRRDNKDDVGGVFMLIFNADDATAMALRERAVYLKEAMKKR